MGRGGPHHGLGDGHRLLGGARRRHAGGQLKRGERSAPVTPGQSDDGVASSFFERVAARQSPLIGYGAPHETGNLLVGQGMQLHHPRARNEGRVHFEERVLGRGAHEHHEPIFHRMQQCVLLAAIEPVDLVDEQDGPQAARDEAPLGLGDLATQVGHGAPDGRHLHKGGLGGLGDDMGKRGLPRARGPEQDDRA